MTGCLNSHLYSILVGFGWTWRVRRFVAKIGPPPKAWDGNKIPICLIPSSAACRAARAGRQAREEEGGDKLAVQRTCWKTEADARKEATGQRSSDTGHFSGQTIRPEDPKWVEKLMLEATAVSEGKLEARRRRRQQRATTAEARQAGKFG
jgi:hypothetical protein